MLPVLKSSLSWKHNSLVVISYISSSNALARTHTDLNYKLNLDRTHWSLVFSSRIELKQLKRQTHCYAFFEVNNRQTHTHTHRESIRVGVGSWSLTQWLCAVYTLMLEQCSIVQVSTAVIYVKILSPLSVSSSFSHPLSGLCCLTLSFKDTLSSSSTLSLSTIILHLEDPGVCRPSVHHSTLSFPPPPIYFVFLYSILIFFLFLAPSCYSWDFITTLSDCGSLIKYGKLPKF